jgi:hypothetical protein
MSKLATTSVMAFRSIPKVDLFKILGDYNEETKTTRFVNVSEFVEDYAELKFGNGGGWSRFDGDFGRKYKVCIVRQNGKLRFSWDADEDQIERLNQELEDEGYSSFAKGTSIMLIKICGVQDNSSARPIRQDIRDALKIKPCVVCGTNSQIEIDHKNGLYNDPRVLDAKTQTVDDFQPLCKHCNDQKRQTCVWQKKNNKRYPATLIPQISIFNIDYTEGDETLDITNVNSLVGTYWYDPVDFMNKVKEQFIKNKCIVNNSNQTIQSQTVEDELCKTLTQKLVIRKPKLIIK